MRCEQPNNDEDGGTRTRTTGERCTTTNGNDDGDKGMRTRTAQAMTTGCRTVTATTARVGMSPQVHLQFFSILNLPPISPPLFCPPFHLPSILPCFTVFTI